MAFSSIKRKTCKKDGCPKYPRIGYKGYCSFECMEPEMRETETKKTVSRRKNQYEAKISKLLHQASKSHSKNKSAENKPKNSLKSDCLIEADKVFGGWIKARDTDKEGNGTCPCCNKRFNLGDKTDDGVSAVNVLHFVVRTVYSERFNENNLFAGHSMCNLKMHLKKTGREFQNYRKFLVKKLGEQEVERMENARRNINKLSEGDLISIIEKYKPKFQNK